MKQLTSILSGVRVGGEWGGVRRFWEITWFPGGMEGDQSLLAEYGDRTIDCQWGRVIRISQCFLIVRQPKPSDPPPLPLKLKTSLLYTEQKDCLLIMTLSTIFMYRVSPAQSFGFNRSLERTKTTLRMDCVAIEPAAFNLCILPSKILTVLATVLRSWQTVCQERYKHTL